MIAKPSIIITSLGRTGTKFFAHFFQQELVNATVLHEPDLFTTSDIRYEGVGHLIRQLKESGVYKMMIRKLYGKWNLIEISDARVRGEKAYQDAVAEVIGQRNSFVSTQKGNFYVESSVAYYGLLDVLESAFADVRSIYIIRDGRTWIRSWMDWAEKGGMYNKGKLRSLVAHTWPTALEFKDDPYYHRWSDMTRFEKLCWGWARLNHYALETVEKSPSARCFRFEDIFLAENRVAHLRELTSHLISLRGLESMSSIALNKSIEQPVHQSKRQFPSWSEWSDEQREQFHVICGPLMHRLGYEYE